MANICACLHFYDKGIGGGGIIFVVMWYSVNCFSRLFFEFGIGSVYIVGDLLFLMSRSQGTRDGKRKRDC